VPTVQLAPSVERKAIIAQGRCAFAWRAGPGLGAAVFATDQADAIEEFHWSFPFRFQNGD